MRADTLWYGCNQRTWNVLLGLVLAGLIAHACLPASPVEHVKEIKIDGVTVGDQDITIDPDTSFTIEFVFEGTMDWSEVTSTAGESPICGTPASDCTSSSANFCPKVEIVRNRNGTRDCVTMDYSSYATTSTTLALKGFNESTFENGDIVTFVVKGCRMGGTTCVTPPDRYPKNLFGLAAGDAINPTDEPFIDASGKEQNVFEFFVVEFKPEANDPPFVRDSGITLAPVTGGASSTTLLPHGSLSVKFETDTSTPGPAKMGHIYGRLTQDGFDRPTLPELEDDEGFLFPLTARHAFTTNLTDAPYTTFDYSALPNENDRTNTYSGVLDYLMSDSREERYLEFQKFERWYRDNPSEFHYFPVEGFAVRTPDSADPKIINPQILLMAGDPDALTPNPHKEFAVTQDADGQGVFDWDGICTPPPAQGADCSLKVEVNFSTTDGRFLQPHYGAIYWGDRKKLGESISGVGPTLAAEVVYDPADPIDPADIEFRAVNKDFTTLGTAVTAAWVSTLDNKNIQVKPLNCDSLTDIDCLAIDHVSGRFIELWDTSTTPDTLLDRVAYRYVDSLIFATNTGTGTGGEYGDDSVSVVGLFDTDTANELDTDGNPFSRTVDFELPADNPYDHTEAFGPWVPASGGGWECDDGACKCDANPNCDDTSGLPYTCTAPGENEDGNCPPGLLATPADMTPLLSLGGPFDSADASLETPDPPGLGEGATGIMRLGTRMSQPGKAVLVDDSNSTVSRQRLFVPAYYLTLDEDLNGDGDVDDADDGAGVLRPAEDGFPCQSGDSAHAENDLNDNIQGRIEHRCPLWCDIHLGHKVAGPDRWDDCVGCSNYCDGGTGLDPTDDDFEPLMGMNSRTVLNDRVLRVPSIYVFHLDQDAGSIREDRERIVLDLPAQTSTVSDALDVPFKGVAVTDSDPQLLVVSTQSPDGSFMTAELNGRLNHPDTNAYKGPTTYNRGGTVEIFDVSEGALPTSLATLTSGLHNGTDFVQANTLDFRHFLDECIVDNNGHCTIGGTASTNGFEPCGPNDDTLSCEYTGSFGGIAIEKDCGGTTGKYCALVTATNERQKYRGEYSRTVFVIDLDVDGNPPSPVIEKAIMGMKVEFDPWPDEDPATTLVTSWPQLNAVWGTQPDDVFAVGDAAGEPTRPKIVQWDGSSWSSLTPPAVNKALNDIWANRAVDQYGEPLPAGTNGAGASDDVVLYAVGDNGTAVKSTDGGSSWTDISPSGVTKNLYGVWGGDKDHVVAVGAGGTILYTSDGGTSWTAATTFHAYTGVGSSACGTAPCRKTGFTDPTSGAGVTFRSVWGLGELRTRYSGAGNSPYPSDSCSTDPSEFPKQLFVVGDDGSIYTSFYPFNPSEKTGSIVEGVTDAGRPWKSSEQSDTSVSGYTGNCRDTDSVPDEWKEMLIYPLHFKIPGVSPDPPDPEDLYGVWGGESVGKGAAAAGNSLYYWLGGPGGGDRSLLECDTDESKCHGLPYNGGWADTAYAVGDNGHIYKYDFLKTNRKINDFGGGMQPLIEVNPDWRWMWFNQTALNPQSAHLNSILGGNAMRLPVDDKSRHGQECDPGDDWTPNGCPEYFRTAGWEFTDIFAVGTGGTILHSPARGLAWEAPPHQFDTSWDPPAEERVDDILFKRTTGEDQYDADGNESFGSAGDEDDDGIKWNVQVSDSSIGTINDVWHGEGPDGPEIFTVGLLNEDGFVRRSITGKGGDSPTTGSGDVPALYGFVHNPDSISIFEDIPSAGDKYALVLATGGYNCLPETGICANERDLNGAPLLNPLENKNFTSQIYIMSLNSTRRYRIEGVIHVPGVYTPRDVTLNGERAYITFGRSWAWNWNGGSMNLPETDLRWGARDAHIDYTRDGSLSAMLSHDPFWGEDSDKAGFGGAVGILSLDAVFDNWITGASSFPVIIPFEKVFYDADGASNTDLHGKTCTTSASDPPCYDFSTDIAPENETQINGFGAPGPRQCSEARQGTPPGVTDQNYMDPNYDGIHGCYVDVTALRHYGEWNSGTWEGKLPTPDDSRRLYAADVLMYDDGGTLKHTPTFIQLNAIFDDREHHHSRISMTVGTPDGVDTTKIERLDAIPSCATVDSGHAKRPEWDEACLDGQDSESWQVCPEPEPGEKGTFLMIPDSSTTVDLRCVPRAAPRDVRVVSLGGNDNVIVSNHYSNITEGALGAAAAGQEAFNKQEGLRIQLPTLLPRDRRETGHVVHIQCTQSSFSFPNASCQAVGSSVGNQSLIPVGLYPTGLAVAE